MSGGKLSVQIGADKTDFDKKIKEVEFDIKELSKVKLDRLKLGLDTTQINAQIKDAKASLNSLKTTVKDTGQSFTNMTPKVANGGNALMQFSRIAQDAPFGIIGIGNNITATAESFSYLKQQTGSTGGALKALASSIMGTGGILLGVSLLTTGLTLMAQSGLSVQDVINKLTGNFDELGAEIKKVNQEAAKQSGTEIANMKALISVAQDDTKSRQDRLIAVKELQSEFPAYFGNLNTEKILNGDLTAVTEELTLAIIARAKASAFAGKIGELAVEELVITQKLLKAYEELGKGVQGSQRGATRSSAAVQFAGLKKAISDIEGELAKNTRAQEVYTEKINESTAAAIKLKQEAGKVTKPVKVFDTPQVTAIPQLISAPSFNLNTIKTFNGQIDAFGNKVKALPNIIETEMLKASVKANEGAILMNAALVNFNNAASEIINVAIVDTFAGLGAAIGNALANGANVLEAVGSTLLSSLGGILTDMGKMAIQVGIGLLGIRAALQSLNPAVAIAAGVALIALGSFFSSKSKAIGGSIGGGATSGASGSGANNQSFSSSGFSSRSNEGGTVVFEIAGQKLVGVLSNTLNANRRLGGTLGLG